MTERTIEIEAESLEEARKMLKSQIPEGFRLLSERAISDGESRTVQASADTTEAAFTKAQSQIPNNADVLKKEILAAPEREIITVEAFDEQGAKTTARSRARSQFENAMFKSLRLTIAGSRGFLGIGKKPNQYEAEIVQQAIVEVNYKTKAKISAKIKPIEPKLELTELATLAGNAGFVQAVALSRDGTMLAAALWKGDIRLFEVPGGRELAVFEEQSEALRCSLAFSPDGSLLVSAKGGMPPIARIWDIESRREVSTLEHEKEVNSIAFSPDGALLACASGTLGSLDKETNVVKLWEIPSGREFATLRRVKFAADFLEGAPLFVVFSPDGSLLASSWPTSSSNGVKVRLWRVQDWSELAPIEIPLGDPFELAFSPDGSMLAVPIKGRTLSPDGFPLPVPEAGGVKLFEVPNGRELASLPGEGHVRHVAFSSGGSLLAAVSHTDSDRPGFRDALQVWEMPSKRQMMVKYSSEFDKAIFSPDTSLMVTCAGNDIKVWGVSGTGIREISVDKQTPWIIPQSEVKVEEKLASIPQEPPRKLTREEVLALMAAGHTAGERADLARTDLRGLDLSGTNLEGANLEEAKLAGANLTGTELNHASLKNADLPGANLTGAGMRGAILQGANLSRAILSSAILDLSYLEGANLSGALLDKQASLVSARLIGANLKDANLTGAFLQYAKLNDADLTGADLTGAHLDYTIMPNGEIWSVASQLFGATRRVI